MFLSRKSILAKKRKKKKEVRLDERTRVQVVATGEDGREPCWGGKEPMVLALGERDCRAQPAHGYRDREHGC